MEDILASIRRIIADDDAANPPPKAPEPPAMPASFPSPRMAEGRVGAVPPAPAQVRASQQTVAPPETSIEEEMTSEDLEQPKSSEAIAKTRSDVLELTETIAAPATPPADKLRKIDRSEMILAPRPADKPELHASRAESQRPLLSAATTTAVNSAFNVLAQTVLVQNARTLDDLVKEMLRPLLKSWLDDNLPGLVERLVRAEIERVSRGRS
jgi:cell pole-organizing protein PopZ